MNSSRGAPPTSHLESQTAGLSRRDFLAIAGGGAFWATLGASIVALARFLGFVEPEPARTFTLDTPAAYPLSTLTSVAEGRAFIGRDDRGLYAIRAACTHLGCPVKLYDQGFECPCHGSRFSASGDVVRGPAEQPLERAALSLDSTGRLVIDLRQTVDGAHRLAVSE